MLEQLFGVVGLVIIFSPGILLALALYQWHKEAKQEADDLRAIAEETVYAMAPACFLCDGPCDPPNKVGPATFVCQECWRTRCFKFPSGMGWHHALVINYATDTVTCRCQKADRRDDE